MGCLPLAGDVKGVLTAPRLIVRGLSRRLSRWLVLHHQRRLRKISLRRYHRELRSKRQSCTCELLLKTKNSALVNSQVRPLSDTNSSLPSESSLAMSTITDREDNPERLNSYSNVKRYLGQSLISELICGEGCKASIVNKENSPACLEKVNQYENVCKHSITLHKELELVLPPNLFKIPNSTLFENQSYGLHNILPVKSCRVENNCGRGYIGRGYHTSLRRCSPRNIVPTGNDEYLGIGEISLIHHPDCDHQDLIDDSHHGQMCIDGRDGNRTWPGLPQTSSTTSSTPSKPHPSSKQMTRTLAQGSNSPVRNKPLVKLPTNSSAASLLAQYEEPSPQFKSDAPSEKAPKPPPQLSDLSNDKRFQILPSCVERVNIGDGESIELSPLYRRLIDRPYFHVISRSKSKKSLEKAADGVFLIRPSTRSSDPLTLCLQYCGRTYNINIRKRNDGHYALGTEKVNEMTFKSIDELVSTYSKEPIKLQNGDRVRLKGSPAKEDHIYVRMPIPVQNNY
ncbi:uncharacterized protein [Palaemon carinicauda]|uniref:uncharacterized protein isoform X3 n=1 Tax=Palaemon carinicauda TaxID=392227 RepID=UPI0035B67811